MYYNRDKIPFKSIPRPLLKLKHLTIEFNPGYHVKLISCLNEHLPNLQSIHLKGQPIIGFYPTYLPPIHFDNVEEFSADTGIQKFCHMPFSFNKLKHFTVFGPILFSKDLIRIISEAENLKTLNILRLDDFNMKLYEIFNLKNVLENVEVMGINIESYYDHKMYSPYRILRFLNQCQSLKKLTISLDFEHERNGFIERIRSRLSIEWRITEKLKDGTHYLDIYKDM